jgi:hypothetical protein
MFSLSKRVCGRYKLLVVKMDEGNVILEIVKVNYNLLCDVENTPRFGLCVTFVGSNVRTIQVCPRA